MAPSGKPLSLLADLTGGRLVSPISTPSDSNPLIFDVTHDSRQAGPGVLFVAVVGSTVDGHDFVEDVARAGSRAVCVERPTGSDAIELVVDDTRRALALLAAEVHEHPSHDLSVIGVTGTDGKTTVTHYVESIATSAGRAAGLIGTIEARIGDRVVRTMRTTPEASDFQRLLAQMKDGGIEIVGAEVSSHALAMRRVESTRFRVAAFTNLSQDHLDFHGDMQSYRAAKERLFLDHEVGTAVINIDDPTGREIARNFGGDLLTVGTGGDVRYSRPTSVGRGTRFNLSTPWGPAELVAPVLGDFNLENSVLAAACLLACGIEFEAVTAGVEALPGVPGRFELVSDDDPIHVLVDYAHTPAAIAKAVSAGRGIGDGKVVALIGAGGDRDAGKRPMMGAAAATADFLIITSDNPRSEDPEMIVRAVASGVPPTTDHIVELDRSSAIRKAIDLASDGDVVLVLGRGHEETQEIGGENRPLDDRVEARAALVERRRSTDSLSDSGSMKK